MNLPTSGRIRPTIRLVDAPFVDQFIASQTAGLSALFSGDPRGGIPRAARLDVGGLGTDNRDPVLHCLGEELRSVVGPDVSGNARRMNRSKPSLRSSEARWISV